MKIAVSATTPNLDADIDPRFGRCQYFIIVDPDTMEFETLANSGAAAGGGAGIATAQTLTGKNIETVITGNCGPNAYDALTAAGIKVVTNASGKVRDAVRQYKSGQFKASSQPNVAPHFGSGGRGMGGGMGRGRGMSR
jgi:predicted Fe-Mo cluster-binding NifX family protein